MSLTQLPEAIVSEEAQLWKSFTADDETALRKLMEGFYATLMNYGSKYTKDKEIAKDCIQELFIDLWYQRHQVIQPNSVKAYLLTSLRRRLFRQLRKTVFLAEPIFSGDDESFRFESSPDLILIEHESIVRQAQQIAHYLNELPRRQREIIYLKYYQGLNRNEIAEVMSITQQSVSNLLQKALVTLRQVIPFNLSSFLLVFLMPHSN
ncbi:sigma-70 family RNA polymerase sigma factor [Spirosoma sp. BT702]|uniref:Sigma-70 family RNA polymerase sigma factor n=1 Tax=Spirosoma profusum TaxID=2771354 RepID=A0A926XVG6_9BACT|nr:sigma-70 family RNA polymerase sigma factor [Spirosoma profusum]MBD2700486.1 sigma-70 family RNA polymerase sigma factor [Spirosoma profusum]